MKVSKIGNAHFSASDIYFVLEYLLIFLSQPAVCNASVIVAGGIAQSLFTLHH